MVLRNVVLLMVVLLAPREQDSRLDFLPKDRVTSFLRAPLTRCEGSLDSTGRHAGHLPQITVIVAVTEGNTV